MVLSRLLSTLIMLASAVCSPAGLQAEELSATQIMEKNFMISKVTDSVSDATFTLISKGGQERIRKTFGTTKLQANGLDNMRMVRFTAPPDVKGTVTLIIEHSDRDDDIWVYLPALKKVRRLVSSNKKESFMGTDFSYDDVIGIRVREWNHQIIKEEAVDGQECYLVESTPLSEEIKNSSGYSKRHSWIRKDNLVMIRGETWDIAGQPFKTFHFTDVRQIDPGKSKWQAMKMEAENIDNGHKTVIQLENFKSNQGIKDDYFTTRYMEKE